MLAKVAPPTKNFHALARYLVHGREGAPDGKRVAWIFAQNLPTEDPELAAKLMTATAALSPRTRRAVYHLMIAWAPDERPEPALMQAIARETLVRAGLGDHEALVMGHGDRDHAHLHMMVNRVNPNTGVAWRVSHDYARFDRIMRELAETHGFRAVPAHSYAPDETEAEPKQPGSRARRAAIRGARTGRPQWSRAEAIDLGVRISETLDASSTWEDLVDVVNAEGYTLEPKGRGFVVGDASGYAKLSRLQLVHTAKGLRARQRKMERPRTTARTRENVFGVDAIDIAQAMVTLGLANKSLVREAVEEAEAARRIRLQQAPLMVQLLHQLGRASTSLSPPLAPKRGAERRKRAHKSRVRHPSRSMGRG